MLQKKLQITFLLVLFILFAVSVGAQEPFHYNSLILEQKITNQLTIEPTQSQFQLNSLEITLHDVVANDHHQRLISQDTQPTAISEPQGLVYLWEEPTQQEFSIAYTARVQTTNGQDYVDKKVSFPITTVPPDIQPFLQETEIMDITPDISLLANQLAADNDDLFFVEYALAQWVVNNINYSLSSLTSDISQPASWVLKEGYGVCDEITALFISLNRALGIPARFVSGIAYTNSDLFEESWGNHGWAEVYFPEVGWVPYDVTYGQFGYLDATHIALYKGIDGTKSSVDYSTLGMHYELLTQPLEFETTVVSQQDLRQPLTQRSISMAEEHVAFSSYNIVDVELYNTQNHYVIEDIRLVPTQGIALHSPQQQHIILKPNQRRHLRWLVEVNVEEDPLAQFSFPIVVQDSLGNQIQTQFTVDAEGEFFTESYMRSLLDGVFQESFTTDSSVLCTPTKEQFQLTDDIEIICSFEHLNNSILPVEVCLQEHCQQAHEIEAELLFSFQTNNTGVASALFTAHAQNYEQRVVVPYTVAKETSLSIEELRFSDQLNFSQQGFIAFTLVKDGCSAPQNVKIMLNAPTFQEEWFYENISTNKKIQLNLLGSQLQKGQNPFTLELQYTTNYGVTKNKSFTGSINLITQKPTQRIVTASNKLLGGITQFTSVLFSTSKPTSLQQLMVLIGFFGLALGVIVLVKRILFSH